MHTLKSFYKSKEWETLTHALRLERINEEGVTICAECGQPIVKAYDCVAHHIDPLTEGNVNDYNIALNPDNIILVHHGCHNKIHQRFGYNRQTRKVYIVYGSPCAGKTTWVREVAGKHDLILDIDKLYEAVTVNDRHHKSNAVTQNIFGLRDCLLEQIKMRVGRWDNAYVIGGYPVNIERERLAEKLGAELIFIDTPKAVCLERAETPEWRKFIKEWFDAYIAPPDRNRNFEFRGLAGGIAFAHKVKF